MKLRTEECRVRLRGYKVANKTEEIAVNTLLTISSSDVYISIPKVTSLKGPKLLELTRTIKRIMKDLGIQSDGD